MRSVVDLTISTDSTAVFFLGGDGLVVGNKLLLRDKKLINK